MYRMVTNRGFTLVEMMVTIGIIGLLSAIIFAAVGGAREDARDGKRQADIKQLELAFKLYKEANGSYPDCAGWFDLDALSEGSAGDCSDESELQTLMQNFVGSNLSDPKSGGVDDPYRYIYDSAHTCTKMGGAVPVLFVRTMEGGGNMEGGPCDAGGGIADYDGDGRKGSEEAYYIVLQ